MLIAMEISLLHAPERNVGEKHEQIPGAIGDGMLTGNNPGGVEC